MLHTVGLTQGVAITAVVALIRLNHDIGVSIDGSMLVSVSLLLQDLLRRTFRW
jgi:hypothetical protein